MRLQRHHLPMDRLTASVRVCPVIPGRPALQLFSQELSPRDIRSIGAFVLEQLGHIPESGERVSVSGIEFTVEQVTDRVIDRIRVKRLPQETPSSED